MTARLITAAELADLLGAEPAEPAVPDEPGREYAPATSADITEVAARIGWLSDGHWLYPVVPASPA